MTTEPDNSTEEFMRKEDDNNPDCYCGVCSTRIYSPKEIHNRLCNHCDLDLHGTREDYGKS